MPKTKVLIVVDEPDIRKALEVILQEWGYDVRLASDGAEARDLVESCDPGLVISDVVMPELSGLDLLRLLKAGNPNRPVLLVTADANIDVALESMKQGAQDFITKPMDYPKLRAILKAAESDIEMRTASRKLRSQFKRGPGFGEFVGNSKAMREVCALIQSLSSSDAPAIMTGESGTGKELAARTIHRLSSRAGGPFIAVHSAAFTETFIESEVFELANGGSLFLDEIGEMPPAIQPKLLRVLKDGKVNVRVIAATSQQPRGDLVDRLSVFTMHLPALRDRKEDIPLLAQHFIGEFNRKHGTNVEALRNDAAEMLMACSWPGNVREFRNVMERAIVLANGEWIETFHLPPYLRHPEIVLSIGMTAAEAERELILKTLEKTGHNKAAAARQLGLDVKTIRNKLKSYRMN